MFLILQTVTRLMLSCTEHLEAAPTGLVNAIQACRMAEPAARWFFSTSMHVCLTMAV